MNKAQQLAVDINIVTDKIKELETTEETLDYKLDELITKLTSCKGSLSRVRSKLHVNRDGLAKLKSQLQEIENDQ